MLSVIDIMLPLLCSCIHPSPPRRAFRAHYQGRVARVVSRISSVRPTEILEAGAVSMLPLLDRCQMHDIGRSRRARVTLASLGEP